MREENEIRDRFGTDSGFRVPDGYFDSMRAEVSGKLGPMVKLRPVAKLSTWQKVRPYIYLAAMFAGIWCMMKLFHTMGTSDRLSLDNPPEAVAAAMSSIDSYDYYMQTAADADFELMSEVGSDYDNMSEFQEDFDYDLKPEYASDPE